MTKNAPFLIILYLLAILTGCSTEPEEAQEIALSKSEVNKRMLTSMVQQEQKERAIVMQYYNKLDQSVKNNITFNQYYTDLARKYQQMTKRALMEAQGFDHNSDPETQVSRMRSKVNRSSDIPYWYIDLKKSSKEKILEAGK